MGVVRVIISFECRNTLVGDNAHFILRSKVMPLAGLHSAGKFQRSQWMKGDFGE